MGTGSGGSLWSLDFFGAAKPPPGSADVSPAPVAAGQGRGLRPAQRAGRDAWRDARAPRSFLRRHPLGIGFAKLAGKKSPLWRVDGGACWTSRCADGLGGPAPGHGAPHLH